MRPEELAGEVMKAMDEALEGTPGPVHLSLPTDVLEGEIGPRAIGAVARAPDDSETPSINVSYVTKRLSRSQSPLILCGPACMTRTGRAKMAALEGASGIPVVGMESPRGVNDPSLGAFADVIAEADCVVLVGKRPDFTLKFGKAFAPGCEVVNFGASRNVIDLLDVLALARPKAANGDWLPKVRLAIAHRPSEWGQLQTVQVLRPLQAILDEHPDAVFVCDGGEFGQWAQACLTAPHRVINGVAGSIGSGLPFAVAARCAVPDAPVLAFMGDGTFGFHPAEIDTAVRYRLPFVAIVGNDARWNAEYQIQLRAYGRERLVGCELLPTRYDEVARAFGGYGENVTEASGVLPAVRRAIASGLPAVVNVAIEGLAAPTLARNR